MCYVGYDILPPVARNRLQNAAVITIFLFSHINRTLWPPGSRDRMYTFQNKNNKWIPRESKN